ncbi:MAG: hypothetical protein ABJB97_08730 [Acidobacteriota bacterium]
MKTHRPTRAAAPRFFRARQRPCAGSSLLLVMFAIAVVSVFVGLAISGTSQSARLSTRAQSYVNVEKAAEGAVEYGFGIWKARIVAKARPLTQGDLNASPVTGPTFPDMSYGTVAENGPLKITATDEYGAPAATSTRVYTNLPAYPGYKGFSYGYVVSTKMRQTNGYGAGTVAGVKRQVQYVEVPIFQSMFFFEHDLTIAQPAQMIVGGLIHTNSNLYLNGSTIGSLTVNGDASYSGNYSETTDPPFISSWSPWTPSAKLPPVYDAGGKTVQLSQVSRFEPFGDKPSAVLDPAPSVDSSGNPIAPQNSDGNPNNDSFRELIEPPVPGFTDPPEIAQRRLYNKAGIIIDIIGPVVTVRTGNGTTLSATRTTELRSAVTGKTTIWDQREGRKVTVANIDMSQVTATLEQSGVKNFNGVLYVQDITPSALDPNPKTVRLQNGGVLPDGGLTIASQNPVYIQGDYNTGTTSNPNVVPANATGNPTNTDSSVAPGYTEQPSAVIADAVMLLSNNWNDANASLAIGSRLAANTTYNTAIMSGFMPSGFMPSSGAQYGYSGGAINFPRFLERWTGTSCTYYGSMVELFQSKTFTGEWDTGNIYNPPARRWNYDTMFSSTPPPGAVDAVVIARGSWAKF